MRPRIKRKDTAKAVQMAGFAYLSAISLGLGSVAEH